MLTFVSITAIQRPLPMVLVQSDGANREKKEVTRVDSIDNRFNALSVILYCVLNSLMTHRDMECISIGLAPTEFTLSNERREV